MSKAEDSCDRALRQMLAFLDAELPVADTDAIREHLVACEPCLGHYETEELIRKVITRGCQEKAPVELRAKIIQALQTVSER